MIELVSGTSRGIRLKGDALRSINESRNKQFSLPLQSLAQLALPLIGRVAAGSPILAQEHVDQTYYVESSLFQRRPDYLLKVRGMSMRDAGIMDGDLLAVQATKEAKNGQIVVARLGDDVTVKRFRRNKHLIELHAENPDYPTIVVRAGRALRDRRPGRRPDPQHHADVAHAGPRQVAGVWRKAITLREPFESNPACVQPPSHPLEFTWESLLLTFADLLRAAAGPCQPLDRAAPPPRQHGRTCATWRSAPPARQCARPAREAASRQPRRRGPCA